MENRKMHFDPYDTAIMRRTPEQARQNDSVDTTAVFYENKQSIVNGSENCLSWEVRGAVFPHGTELRGKYKGYVYYGKVDNGKFLLHGKPFLSPSAAATSITRNTVNGWLFWDCKLPGRSTWRSICQFRNG